MNKLSQRTEEKLRELEHQKAKLTDKLTALRERSHLTQEIQARRQRISDRPPARDSIEPELAELIDCG